MTTFRPGGWCSRIAGSHVVAPRDSIFVPQGLRRCTHCSSSALMEREIGVRAAAVELSARFIASHTMREIEVYVSRLSSVRHKFPTSITITLLKRALQEYGEAAGNDLSVDTVVEMISPVVQSEGAPPLVHARLVCCASASGHGRVYTNATVWFKFASVPTPFILPACLVPLG